MGNHQVFFFPIHSQEVNLTIESIILYVSIVLKLLSFGKRFPPENVSHTCTQYLRSTNVYTECFAFDSRSRCNKLFILSYLETLPTNGPLTLSSSASTPASIPGAGSFVGTLHAVREEN